jgi:hypothetical protein
MDIAIAIIFACAFYLELAPEWETTFTRKDREPSIILLLMSIIRDLVMAVRWYLPLKNG